MVFVVLNVKNNIAYLKGVNDRLYADSPLEDCELISKDLLKDNFVPQKLENDNLDKTI